MAKSPQLISRQMKWFTNKQKRLEMIQAVRPTSKATLKMQCLMVCKGDIDEANKLYDYFAKDMPELPDYDPVQPTWVDNTKQTANGIMAWIGENKDTLAQVYEFFRGAIQNRALPPITSEAPAAAEPLPPIN
jgi:hypothetical protein